MNFCMWIKPSNSQGPARSGSDDRSYLLALKAPEHCRSYATQSPPLLTRRDMLRGTAGGLAGIALSCLLGENSRRTSAVNSQVFDLLPRPSHFAPKARNVIFIYLGGGPS